MKFGDDTTRLSALLLELEVILRRMASPSSGDEEKSA
jgi:hypothetical protein